jgi:UDP-N-acetylglucosamine 4,6-dehydratase (inverting)
MFDGSSILITGGTGSFGRAFVQQALERFPTIRRVVVFSRDELKQYQMALDFPKSRYPQLEFIIGDVRDPVSVEKAFYDVDYVVHAAAMKHVPIAEQNTWECVKTNVLGAEHVIEGALRTGVRAVVALSTTKASAPANLYGATKLCSDKLFSTANLYRAAAGKRFSIVRFGNILGASGSVVPYFLKKRTEGILPVTHPDMTRFTIRLEEAVDLVLHALMHSWGGETWVPKIPSFRVLDLARAISSEAQIEYIGIRPGEKLHEDLISEAEGFDTVENGRYFVILPSIGTWDRSAFAATHGFQPVTSGFRYSSELNTEWLTVAQLRSQIEAIFGTI